MKRKNLNNKRDTSRYTMGQTYPRYGLMRKLDDGSFEFLQEYSFSMGMGKEYAATWQHPPHHYLTPELTIVNFRKSTSPVVLGEHRVKSNFNVILKDDS